MKKINRISNIIFVLIVMYLLSCDNRAKSSGLSSMQSFAQSSVQTTDTTDVASKQKFIKVENGFKDHGFEATEFGDALPTMDIAFDVAFSILSGIYGKEHCENYFPYEGYLLRDSVWVFYGTMPVVKEGGFPYIEINKRDGKVLRLTHYK